MVKRVLIFLMAIVILCVSVPYVNVQAEIITLEQEGDMNCDGAVTASDALDVLTAIVKPYPLSARDLAVADLDFNSMLNVEDALLILK